MACTKSFSFVQPTVNAFPMDEAVYVGTVGVTPVDKIFGVCGAYIYQCNANTGVLENWARVTGPLRSETRICYHSPTQRLYVSGWNSHASLDTTKTRPQRDIYAVNPLNLEIGAPLGVTGIYGGAAGRMDEGPVALISCGNYLHYQWHSVGSTYIYRINPSNIADRATTTKGDGVYYFGQIATDGTNIYFGYQNFERIVYYVGNTGAGGTYCALSSTGIYMPFSVEWCTSDSKCYACCGNKWVIRVDDWPSDGHTGLEIPAALDATPTPLRIRWHTANNFIYLPSGYSNKVLIYHVPSDTWQLGLASGYSAFQKPHDIVVTPTKAFAVQKGPIGLMEILTL